MAPIPWAPQFNPQRIQKETVGSPALRPPLLSLARSRPPSPSPYGRGGSRRPTTTSSAALYTYFRPSGHLPLSLSAPLPAFKMIGPFLARAFLLVLGYAYPAYQCYKTVEMNKPEVKELRFWCQYWILVAMLTVLERFADIFVSWLPMYSEAKLAFFVYLWYSKTKGTAYVYETFFRPYIAKHEMEIDRNLLELKTRAGDVVLLCWRRATTYGQERFFEIMQYVALQSHSSRAPPAQQPQQTHQESPATARTPSASQQEATVPPPSPKPAAPSSHPPDAEQQPMLPSRIKALRSFQNDQSSNSPNRGSVASPKEAENEEASGPLTRRRLRRGGGAETASSSPSAAP